MKTGNYFTKTLRQATFGLALVLALGGLAACHSDLEGDEEAGRSIPDARPIILNLTKKIETDNSFAFEK